MAFLFQLPKQVPLSAGAVVPGAKANFYLTGTTTPTDTYSDSALTTPNANPVEADANGVFDPIYLDPDVAYKVTLTDADDVLIYTEDPVIDSLTQANVGRILYPRTAAETAAGVTPTNYQYESCYALRYGTNTTPGTTDMHQAVTDAITVAVTGGGGEVILPNETLRIESDLELRDFVRLRGEGNGSLLEFNGCALQLDAVAAANPDISSRHLTEWSLDNVRVSRVGTAGYAVECVTTGGTGASDNNDVIRYSVRDLHIVSSTGGGLYIEGSYLGSFYSLFVRNCSGVGLKIDEQTGTLDTSLQGASFFGGEIQDCDVAGEFDRARCVAFYGTAFEGCAAGVTINFGLAYTFDGCYFESNDDYDLRIGSVSGGGPDCMAVRGCRFFGDGVADYAIDAIRCNSLTVESCAFQNYATAGVNRNGASSGSVTGVIRRCEGLSSLTLLANGNASFHIDPEERTLAFSGTWDSGSIAAGAAASNDFTATGAAIGDFVQVAVSGGTGGCLPATGEVITSDQVRVHLFNPSASPIDPSSRTFRILVQPRDTWF